MNNIEDHPQSTSCKLAEYLESNQEELISGWVAQVRRDSDIPSDSLTKPEIIDHVPKILEAVLHALRQQYGDKTMGKVQVVTARHTVVRWVQGYDLDAVLREGSLLRAAFMDYARTFHDKNEIFSGSERHLAYTTINRIFDDTTEDATDMFLKLRARTD